jgi:hypothetical protein
VSKDRVDAVTKMIEESDGPPAGVTAHAIELLFDESQGTAVVLQRFASAEDMEAGARALSAMDAAETPGTRASVDSCVQSLSREL